MSSIDTLITSDLTALGEDSRRNLVGVDDALRTQNMYRDDRPGAEARRDALAEERRRELVMMPLTLSHVFAHRVGRAAAGAAGLACTRALVAIISDPLLLQVAAWLVPGLDVGILGLLTFIAVLAVYVIATWIAEAWFARRMRAAIRTGEDPYRDLDELARGPVEVAQQAVRRVDGISLGLFLAGMTSLAIGFGYVVAILGSLYELPYALSMSAVVDTGALEKNLGVLVNALLLAGGMAFWLGRSARRGTRSRFIAVLSSWWTLLVAGMMGVPIAYVTFRTIALIGVRRDLPPEDVRYLIGFGATIALVGLAAWVLLWWRDRENRRIGE